LKAITRRAARAGSASITGSGASALDAAQSFGKRGHRAWA